MLSIKHIVKRILVYFLMLFIAVTINFFVPRLMPGDPVQMIVTRFASMGLAAPQYKAIADGYRVKFGLDKDLFTQYTSYLAQLARGDFGPSLSAFPTSVLSLISRAAPWTLGLLFTTLVISWVIGNLLGVFLSMRRGGKLDFLLTYAMLFMSQIPYYVLAMFLVFALAYLVPIFPLSGGYSVYVVQGLNFPFILNVLWHSFLPALSLVLVSLGGWMITMRSNVINILGEDYLFLAKAKGLGKRTITINYLFRNAMLPQVTGLALAIGYVTSGALLTEIVFSYPGLGQLFLWAVESLDYTLMQGVFIVVAFTVLTAQLVLDLVYPLIDPRIR